MKPTHKCYPMCINRSQNHTHTHKIKSELWKSGYANSAGEFFLGRMLYSWSKSTLLARVNKYVRYAQAHIRRSQY